MALQEWVEGHAKESKPILLGHFQGLSTLKRFAPPCLPTSLEGGGSSKHGSREWVPLKQVVVKGEEARKITTEDKCRRNTPKPTREPIYARPRMTSYA